MIVWQNYVDLIQISSAESISVFLFLSWDLINVLEYAFATQVLPQTVHSDISKIRTPRAYKCIKTPHGAEDYNCNI